MSDHVIDHSVFLFFGGMTHTINAVGIQNLIPAAAYIEMALEFPDVTHVWDCQFESTFILDGSAPPSTLEVSKKGNSWWVKSSSALQSMQGNLEWTRSGAVFDKVHSRGKLGYGKPVLEPNDIAHVDVKTVLERCIQTYEKAMLYGDLEGIAQFGPE
jgi:fatty acid synthase